MRIFQLIDARPGAPAPGGVDGVLIAFLLAGIGIGRHRVVALYRHLAALRQVTIARDERVEPADVQWTQAPAAELLLRLPHVQQGAEARRRAVAVSLIVVGKLLVGRGLHADDVQQVAIERLAVVTLDNGRLIFSTFMAGQQAGIGQRLTVPPVSLLLGLYLVLIQWVLGIYGAQHRGIDGPQHRVSGLLPLLQARQERSDGVRGKRSQALSPHQPGLQQVPISPLAGSLDGNLVKQVDLCARQVLVPGLVHFLPKAAVVIGHGGKRKNQCQRKENHFLHR